MATAMPAVDPALLRRYDRPGPRYTSYPTAPQFATSFGETALRQALAESNAEPLPRALSVYVHVPFCSAPCFYCGCNRVITRDAARGATYLGRLHREIALTGALVDRDRPVVELHFGGGTPNFLQPAQLAETVACIAQHFHLPATGTRTLSIELDPRHVTPEQVGALAAIGFNRASLGVQDFDPVVQAAINRVQPRAQTLAIIDACRRYGMQSVNLDLIYGLPHQTPASFARTLAEVIAARPDRLAVYSYAHMPHLFRAQRQIPADALPDPDAKLGLLQLAVDALTDAGYVYIGMDHFALPDDALARARADDCLHRNFMGYTPHADTDLIGLGVSAISHIGDTYSQNPRELANWALALDDGRLPVFRGMTMDADDRLRADVITQLMCQGRVDCDAIGQRHGIAFASYFSEALAQLAPLARDGLVEITDDQLRATPRGTLLLRNLAMCFDRYLTPAQAPDAPRFSRAI